MDNRRSNSSLLSHVNHSRSPSVDGTSINKYFNKQIRQYRWIQQHSQTSTQCVNDCTSSVQYGVWTGDEDHETTETSSQPPSSSSSSSASNVRCDVTSTCWEWERDIFTDTRHQTRHRHSVIFYSASLCLIACLSVCLSVSVCPWLPHVILQAQTSIWCND